jgi:hypothetical protein
MTRRTKLRNQPQPERPRKRKLIPVDPQHVRVGVNIIDDPADSETPVVEIESFHGKRHFAVDHASILPDGMIPVGKPLAKRARFRLIELPHARQRQLVWVDASQLVDDRPTFKALNGPSTGVCQISQDKQISKSQNRLGRGVFRLT